MSAIDLLIVGLIQNLTIQLTLLQLLTDWTIEIELKAFS